MCVASVWEVTYLLLVFIYLAHTLFWQTFLSSIDFVQVYHTFIPLFHILKSHFTMFFYALCGDFESSIFRVLSLLRWLALLVKKLILASVSGAQVS